jgi:hypothetical protein
MHRLDRDWLGRGYVGLFYCGERTAKGSKVTGGEIQGRNDDPRRKPRGTRLEGDALSFPQACLTQWHAMLRNGNDGALPSKKAEARFGVSAPSRIKWHSGRRPLPPGAFGVSATASTALGPMQCGTGR